MATEARVTTVEGLAYGQVRFVGVVQHGTTRREIKLTCSAESILALADAIRGCHRNYEDPKTGRKPGTLDEAVEDNKFKLMWMGHAVWHLEHRDSLMPCLPENTKIIDVPPDTLRLPERAPGAVKDGAK